VGTVCAVAPIELVLHDDPGRVASWSWSGLNTDEPSLDGVAIEDMSPDQTETRTDAPPHPNLIDRVDHLVVATPLIGRTIDAYEAAGLELRRTRTIGEGSSRRTQAFFWAGDLILELVGPTAPEGDGPAAIWGVSFESPDLDGTVAALGPDLIGPARDAVQRGRSIATIRTRDIGISLPLAVMSSHSATRFQIEE
jgi:hypothetical protein